MLDETIQGLLARRLQRIEARVRRIHLLVQDGTHCPELLRDLSQVQDALIQVSSAIVAFHVAHCVSAGWADQSQLAELVDIFDRFL